VIHAAGLRMKPIRKKNSRCPFEPWIFYTQSTCCKMVETAGSLVERLLPKHIHSVTAQDFALKAGLFVLVSSVNALG
jgi:hypothetical protein